MAHCIHGTHWDGISPFWCPQCSTGISHAVAPFTMVAVTTGPLTHRPSRLDAEHTACGERIDQATHLRLGDGETCERCTHVAAQVAEAICALLDEVSYVSKGPVHRAAMEWCERNRCR